MEHTKHFPPVKGFFARLRFGRSMCGQFLRPALALTLVLLGMLLFVTATRAAPLLDAPWEPNVKVNDDVPGSANQTTPALAASKTTDDVFALWQDSRNDDGDIYFAHSPDGGQTWKVSTRVNHDAPGLGQSSPDIALDGSGVLHAVWVDSRAGTEDIYYSRSADNGATWSTEVRLNDVLTGTQKSPAIAALGNKVCVVWEDGRVAYARGIYVDCSTNGGQTWGTDARVNHDDGEFYHYAPDIALGADGRVHIVWYDNRSGNWDIYYTYLSAVGTSDVRLNDGTAGMQPYPAIAASGNTVQVVWADSSSGLVIGDVSTDGGVTWGKDQGVSEVNGTMEPDVTFDGQGTAWATWRVPTTTYRVYADWYGVNGWSADMLVYTSTEFLQSPAIAAGEKRVYVAWEHYFETDVDVLLAIWDGREWTGPVQINDEGDALQASPAIAIGSTGRLYAAWADRRDRVYEYALYADTSLDKGATWGVDVRVDDKHPLQGTPAIGATGPLTVHVAWSSVSQDTGAVFYDRSGNGGQTWGVDRLLNPAGGYGTAGPPDLATDGGQKIFVVWARYDGLWFVSSSDGGTTWISPTIILTATGSMASPTIAVDADGRLHLAWVESLMQTNEEHIAYAHSMDDGLTWTDRQYVDGGTFRTLRSNPDIAVNPVNGYVHLVWDDDRTGTKTVFHAVSSNHGATWGSPAGIVRGPAVEPAIAVDGDGVVYVLWQDGLEGNTEIFYTTSIDDGVSWSVPGRVNDDATTYPQRQVAVVAGNSAYAVWNDFRRVNWDIESAGLTLACPVPLQGVSISGPSETRTGMPVRLEAVVDPSTASPPLTFVWTPTPAAGQGTPSAIYYWQTPGTYPVEVKVSNCGGVFTATATHRIVVTAPTPPLPCVEGRVYYATTPLADIQVELLAGSSGPVLQSTTTNAYGYYRFCNLEPGDYMLKRYGPSPAYADWVADSLTMGGSNVIKNLDLPKKMTLLTPANGETITTTIPTMTWQALPEASHYTFQLNKTADWTLVEHTHNIIGTAHQVLAALDLSTGYTWRIDAYTGTHWVGTTANAFTFTTPGLIILPPPPIVTINSSLRLEEAAQGVVVNKLIGDSSGKTSLNYVDVVAYVSTQAAEAASDVRVVLTVPGNVLGAPVNTWVRDSYGGTPTAATSVSLGGGRYQVTTTLTRGCFWWFCPYRKYVVWRFRIPNTISPQTLSLMSQVYRPGYWVVNSISHATLRLVSTAEALIIVNRTQLYDNYTGYEVTSLLARLYDVAQGAPHNDQPLGVIYNADLYHNAVRDWNNTTVNYANETTANEVANELDELINDWVEDGTWTWSYHLPFSITVSTEVYPYYLLLVGDDDVLPFYRYNDPFNQEVEWFVNSATNPQIRATDNDYILTDAPYANLWGGTDWQVGDLELAVGRLLGATADDMRYLLDNSLATDGGTGRAVMASVDGWELGYNNPSCGANAVADVLNVPARLAARGFGVYNDSETPHTVDVMFPFDVNWITGFRNAANAGMDLFFIGGHASYNGASIPENSFTPDDTCSDASCRYNRFDNDHPLTFIVGCHGGLPVPNIGGRGGINDNMVYDIVHEGGRAYIGATGYSYGSPGSLCHATWGEKLLQHFFDEFLRAGSNSRTIGDALRRAKDVYPFGQYNPNTSATDGDALDRKTVTEFNLYGVPWQRLDYPGGTTNQRASGSLNRALPSAVSSNIGNIVQADTYRYTRTVTVDIAPYTAGQVITGSVTYDVLSIPGGEMAVAPNLPMLPYVRGYTLTMPISATVQSVSLVTATCSDVGPYEIPIIIAQPWSEGGMTFTTTTTITTSYPADANRVVGQMQDGRMLFTLFPIQHNPTSNATRFCSQMVIEVVYDAPVALAVSQVTPLAAALRPGAPISVTALLENVTDELLTVTSTLTLLDAEGHEVGWQNGGPFSVPSGGQQAVEVGWDGMLSEGVYSLLLTFWKNDVLMGLATTHVSIVGGALTALEVPTTTLVVSDTATFRVTFENYLATQVTMTAYLQLSDRGGDLVATLPPQTTVVAGNTTHVFTFAWEVPASTGGIHKAQALVVRADDTSYGPLTGEFTIASPFKEIFLPLVLRNF